MSGLSSGNMSSTYDNQIYSIKLMKKALKIVGSLLIGAIVGFGIAFLLIWIIDGSAGFEKAMHKDFNVSKTAIAVVCSIVCLFVTFILHLAFHETGHMLFGMATGYKFSSIRLWKFAIMKDDNGLHIKKFNIQGTGGQCIMTLPADTDTEQVPYFWYYAGGVLVNLILTATSFLCLKAFDLGMVGSCFFYMLAFTGAMIALMNGMPLSFNGLCNDGKCILLLHKNKRSQRLFLRMVQTASEMARGKRPKDLPREWFEDIAIHSPKDYFPTCNRINYAALLEDLGRFDEARKVYEELAAFGKEMPGLLKLEIGADQILMELLTTARPDAVEQLYDKQLQKYIKSTYKYSPIKCAMLYALALLRDNDKARATQLLDEMESHRDGYLMAGEYHTARFLVEQCDARYSAGIITSQNH